MPSSSERSCFLPFTPASDLTSGLHLYAAVGGGAPHLFEIDTGSVGVLVPRQTLGPAYKNFDRSLDAQVTATTRWPRSRFSRSTGRLTSTAELWV